MVLGKKRIKAMGIGMVAYGIYNQFFDYVFYPGAISYWGIATGGAIAVWTSLVQNATMFWAYDRFQIDWLGAYALRELEVKENKNRFERLAVWAGKADKTWWEWILTAVAFITLLIKVDPLIVAVHFQQQHFQGLKTRDWGILLAAVAIGNAWWLVLSGSVVEAVRFVFRLLFN